MHLGIVDCGTNTFNFILVETGDKGFKVLYNQKMPVKLGQGGINKGYIAEPAFSRGLDALKAFSNKAKEHQVKDVRAFATSAIRDASNGKSFCDAAKQETGIDIQVIDGNREAELIYLGNRMAVPFSEKPVLIFDIGGGSNEYIIGNANQIFWKKSFRLGAARLLELFKPSDPITKNEIEKISAYLNNELKDLRLAIENYKPEELIGSSGAFDSVIEMIHVEKNHSPFEKTQTCYDLDYDEYKKISDRIIASTVTERKAMKGLVEMRVDMMVISCLLIDQILQMSGIRKIRVSAYSLKEGVLFELINKK